MLLVASFLLRLPIDQDGSDNKPANEINDDEWSKMEVTLQDLEKATKQGEQLIERQEKPGDRSKELKELITKLTEVIAENKEVEVSLAIESRESQETLFAPCRVTTRQEIITSNKQANSTITCLLFLG